MENTTSIIFQNPEPPSGLNALWIEEKGWEMDENKISFVDLYRHTGSQLINTSLIGNPYDLASIQSPTHDCGITDGQIHNTIYVYRQNPALGYSLKHSYGELGQLSSGAAEETHFEEVFNFNIEKNATLSYPNIGNLNVTWQGVVYDAVGNVISAPSYVIENNSIVLSEKVYGSLKVSYTLYRDVYTFTVSPGDDSDLFGGVFYALYNGGISWLEVDSPNEITSALLNGDVDCGYQWGNVTFPDSLPDDSDTPPTEAPKVDTTVTTDYCSQVVTSVVRSYV